MTMEEFQRGGAELLKVISILQHEVDLDTTLGSIDQLVSERRENTIKIMGEAIVRLVNEVHEMREAANMLPPLSEVWLKMIEKQKLLSARVSELEQKNESLLRQLGKDPVLSRQLSSEFSIVAQTDEKGNKLTKGSERVITIAESSTSSEEEISALGAVLKEVENQTYCPSDEEPCSFQNSRFDIRNDGQSKTKSAFVTNAKATHDASYPILPLKRRSPVNNSYNRLNTSYYTASQFYQRVSTPIKRVRGVKKGRPCRILRSPELIESSQAPQKKLVQMLIDFPTKRQKTSTSSVQVNLTKSNGDENDKESYATADRGSETENFVGNENGEIYESQYFKGVGNGNDRENQDGKNDNKNETNENLEPTTDDGIQPADTGKIAPSNSSKLDATFQDDDEDFRGIVENLQLDVERKEDGNSSNGEENGKSSEASNGEIKEYFDFTSTFIDETN